jgi:hypothetical protein
MFVSGLSIKGYAEHPGNTYGNGSLAGLARVGLGLSSSLGGSLLGSSLLGGGSLSSLLGSSLLGGGFGGLQ